MEDTIMDGTLNSQASIMLGLTQGLLEDLYVHHQLSPRDLKRDFTTLKARTRAEGLSFLTKTLPSLAKSVDQALLAGKLNAITAFKARKSTKLPAFLHGLFKLVFSEDGTLLDEPDHTAIKDLRQVGFLFYKYQLPYKESLVERLFEDFVATDKDIQSQLRNPGEMGIVYYAQKVINAVFEKFSIEDLRPKNGPGSVANSVPPWGRFEPTRFYPKLDSLVSYCSLYYCNERHLFDHFDRFFDLDIELEGTAKALAVPKDSRGPRLISSEQSEFMTYQQALKNALVPYLESNYLTSGQVNFTCQEINRKLALEGSVSQKWATLDLRKASDLVSMLHVDTMYDETPIYDFLVNSRSKYTELPDGRVITLNKFAPMGSALCFPIEALTFYAICVGEQLSRGIPLKKAAKNVFVYGDDIIVPTEDVPFAIEALENIGLQINKDKSCFTGKFRESCGMDAFNGSNVTPTKLKKLWQEKPEADVLASWLAACNNLFADGYWKASDFLRRSLEKATGKLQLCLPDDPVLGLETWTQKHVFVSDLKAWRWNTALQQFVRRADTIVTPTLARMHCGWKRFLRRSWYAPLSPGAFPWENEVFVSSAFSRRYQAVKHGTWVSLLDRKSVV